MKAIFKQGILEQLDDIIDQASRMNKEIDYVLVTKEDAIKLYNKLHITIVYPCQIQNYLSKEEKVDKINGAYYLGIKLKVEGLE